PDLVVGAPGYSGSAMRCGRVLVYLGSPTGLPAAASQVIVGSGSGAAFGFAVANAGDVNHDGREDVIIGAPTYSNGQAQEGAAYLYLGSASGLQASPAWTVEGNTGGIQFGYAVCGAGDVNGDGYPDLAVGAPFI